MLGNYIKGIIRKGQRGYLESYAKKSFSQCGEDCIIKYLFSLRGIQNPTYLDIGANHPFYLNNTAAFYEDGSRGINIEANASLVKLFQTYRSEDVNLNIGVGPSEGEMEFYMFEDDTLSTFSLQEAEQQRVHGSILSGTAVVKILTLKQVINKHTNGLFPDLLTIDVEGLDFDIMRAADFSVTKPKVICAETAEYSPIGAGAKRTDYIEYIQQQGYYLYADTNLNSIFVDRDFWFNYKR